MGVSVLFFNKHADAPQIPLGTAFWHCLFIGLSLFRYRFNCSLVAWRHDLLLNLRQGCVWLGKFLGGLPMLINNQSQGSSSITGLSRHRPMGLGVSDLHEVEGAWLTSLAGQIAQITKQRPKVRQEPSMPSGHDHPMASGFILSAQNHTKNMRTSPCFHRSYNPVNKCGTTEKLEKKCFFNHPIDPFSTPNLAKHKTT